jgi:hypothetical protein
MRFIEAMLSIKISLSSSRHNRNRAVDLQLRLDPQNLSVDLETLSARNESFGQELLVLGGGHTTRGPIAGRYMPLSLLDLVFGAPTIVIGSAGTQACRVAYCRPPWWGGDVLSGRPSSQLFTLARINALVPLRST